MELHWVKVEKDYRFETAKGSVTLTARCRGFPHRQAAESLREKAGHPRAQAMRR